MRLNLSDMLPDNRIKIAAKALIIIAAAAVICGVFFEGGLDKFKSEEVYTYRSDISAYSSANIDLSNVVEQRFISKGDFLSSISVYIMEASDNDASLSVALKDLQGRIVASNIIGAGTLTAGAWNSVLTDISGLEKEAIYTVSVCTVDSKKGVVTAINGARDGLPYLTSCSVNGREISGKLSIGVNQVYRYFDMAHGMFLCINLLFLSFLIGITAASVWKIEEGIAAVKRRGLDKYALYPVVLTMYSVFMFNPMSPLNTEIQKFSRVMGQGVMRGYDVARVIGNFYGWMLAAGFLYILFAAFIARQREAEHSKELEAAWDFLDKFMFVAGADLLFRCVVFFYNGGNSAFRYSSWLIFLVIFSVMGYIYGKADKAVSFSRCRAALILAFSSAFPIAILSDAEWQDGMLLLGVQYSLAIIFALAMRFVKPLGKIMSRLSPYFTWTAAAAASLCPVALSIYIEAVNVLAGRGIVVTRPFYNYGVAVFVMAAAAGVLFVFLRKTKATLPQVEALSYPFIIAGVSLLWRQVPLTTTYNANIFESANAGVLISDFLNFGDIPIVQHYGGHMMQYVWEGILYGFVNGDYAGAVFSPYRAWLFTPVAAVAFYFFIKEVAGRDAAFWTTLVIPFYSYANYFLLGLLVPTATLMYIKKNRYSRAIFLWLVCAWVTLYRLDLGFAFDIACVIGLLCYVIYEKNAKAAKQLAGTLVGCAAAFLGLWCLLCIAKGINPASRLMEFLMISASNQNWARDNIGDMSKNAYAFGYVITPLFISVSLVCVIFSKKLKERAGTALWVMIIMLGASYLANFQRGIVRHSLVEISDYGWLRVMLTALLYMALFFSCHIKKEIFPLAFAFFLLFGALFKTDSIFNEKCLADAAVNTVTSFCDSWPESLGKLKKNGKPIKRVIVADSLQKRVAPLRQICNLLLSDNETFVDYMNRTFAYCLLQKQIPVYVSQSPLQLSGEYTQERFISEIAENKGKNPIVIMPYGNNNDNFAFSLDWLHNNYRYYKVAEYLWQNYKPLCRSGEYAVWCVQRRFDEMKERISRQHSAVECIDSLCSDEVKYRASNLEVSNDGKSLKLSCTGTDPIISELQSYMDLSPYIGGQVKITAAYRSDVIGTMQMFYTQEYGENYSERNVANYRMTAPSGKAEFIVPVTASTRLRLDIPERSNVSITSIKHGSVMEPIDYGYDRFERDMGSVVYINASQSLHQYGIDMLPFVWAEHDKKNAAGNAVAAPVTRKGRYWEIENAGLIDKTRGNYLFFKLAFAGKDTKECSKPDDEKSAVAVRVGAVKDGKFIELYRYTLNAKEGVHSYLIRVSCDYYWYLKDTNAISIECDSQVNLSDVKILQGD